jgi:hypothetical protein
MKKILTSFFLRMICMAAVISLTSCATWDPNKEQKEADQVEITIEQFMQQDPGLKVFFDQLWIRGFPHRRQGSIYSRRQLRHRDGL